MRNFSPAEISVAKEMWLLCGDVYGNRKECSNSPTWTTMVGHVSGTIIDGISLAVSDCLTWPSFVVGIFK